jgi:hypothetical protein
MGFNKKYACTSVHAAVLGDKDKWCPRETATGNNRLAYMGYFFLQSHYV